MDIHELIEQHRKQIDKAKVAFCQCNYSVAVVMLCNAYASNRQLIQDAYAVMIEAGEKLPAGREISP